MASRTKNFSWSTWILKHNHLLSPSITVFANNTAIQFFRVSSIISPLPCFLCLECCSFFLYLTIFLNFLSHMMIMTFSLLLKSMVLCLYLGYSHFRSGVLHFLLLSIYQHLHAVHHYRQSVAWGHDSPIYEKFQLWENHFYTVSLSQLFVFFH